MNELSIIHKNGVDVIDSREVAEVIGKEHRHLIRDIRNYAEIIENSNEPNFGLVDFFIPHVYTDSKGEQRPCYLLTKKGCDMVANKMTGEKGVLFTAAYVTAFEKMREAVTSPTMIPGLSPQTQALINMELRQNKLEAEQQATKSVVMNTLNTFAAPPTDEEHWRDVMNRKVRQMCEEYGLNYHTTIGEMYAELERRAHVNLATRQKNLRERMRLGGAKYAQREAVSKLVVISQDAKLRYIYEAIVREKAAQLAASRMR
nr:MAG TPA: regulatory protein [Caudoviricetes sp.]